RMKKDGQETVFDQFPSDDAYEFVDMQLENPEALPKISDFSVWNQEGDFTEEVLSGKKLLILISNISKVSQENFDSISLLIADLEGSAIEPVIIRSSSEDEIRNLIAGQGWNAPHFMADATVVKTIIRSNPGIMVLNEGTVLEKYHHNNTPSASEVGSLF